MHHRHFLALAALIVPAPAAAQDTLTATFDLGFVSTAGNTDITTLNVGEKLGYVTGPWAFAHATTIVYGQSGGVETADQWKTGVRADRRLVARLAAYGLASFERNPFAGIGRRMEEAAGLAYKLVTAPRDALDVEGGINFIQQRNLANVTDTFAAGRAAFVFKHMLTTAAFFQQSAELLANLEATDDARVNSETSLVAPISKKLSMKASYLIRYDNQPEPGFEKTDRIFTTGIQLVF